MQTDHPSISWILPAKHILLWILVRTWTHLRVRLNSTLKKDARISCTELVSRLPHPPKKKTNKLYAKRQNMAIRFRDLLMLRNSSRSTAKRHSLSHSLTPRVSYDRQDKYFADVWTGLRSKTISFTVQCHSKNFIQS